MSFVVLASATYSLTVDRAPIVIDRFGDRGRRTQVTAGITGTRFVIEQATAPDDALFNLRFTLLTAAQAETLADILDEGGVLTVRLYTGASTFSAAFAGEKRFEAIVGDHPDADRTGGALASSLTYQKAEVSFYKL